MDLSTRPSRWRALLAFLAENKAWWLAPLVAIAALVAWVWWRWIPLPAAWYGSLWG